MPATGAHEPFTPSRIWTSGGVEKLEVYRKLGVAEVWLWRKGRLEVFELQGQSYVPLPGSRLLSGIDLEQLTRFIDVRPMTRAVREYRAALRGA